MSTGKPQIKFLWIVALLFSTLACQAATQLVFPPTPTPPPTSTPTQTATATPTPLPTFTPTVVFEAACTPLLAEILTTYSSEVILTTGHADQRFQEEDSLILVTYEVAGDKITVPRNRSVPDAWRDWQKDRAAHENIWNYFVSMIPGKQRALLSGYFIFSDGEGNHLAAVSQASEDPEKWVLHVDILDSQNYYDLTYTLIHEQGHLLTLNADQVPPSTAIFDHPNNKGIYTREAAACPQYFTGEGCSETTSYINQFFDRFWPYIYADWEQVDQEEDEDARATLLQDFYRTHEDQFLSDYAATSPVEDIAESWTFFILSPKPELTSIANEKILFFYEYPELVELRAQILEQICVNFPQ